jgi:hypothetical protein
MAALLPPPWMSVEESFAEGEAVLGWLNATYHMKSVAPVEWRAFAERLLGSLSDCIDSRKAAVGHVKLALETGDSLITQIWWAAAIRLN